MTTIIGEVWSDIHQDIKADANGALKKSINVDSVKTSIDNILRTHKGERVMLPEFGASLDDMVFEPMTRDVLSMMARSVRDEIERWESRVTIISSDYYSDPDSNSVNVVIAFAIKGIDEVFTISTIL